MKNIVGITIFGYCIILMIISPGFGWAAELSAHEIAQHVYDRNLGDDVTTIATMELISKNGHIRSRKFTIQSKDYGPVIKQLIRFTSPADIAGTGFLAQENDNGGTEQFLYLPALGRTRRIVSTQKGRSFVNTEFSYEDMQRRPVDEWRHELSGSAELNGINCYIITSTTKEDTETAYSRVKSWVAKEFFMPMRVEFSNRKGEKTKVYRVLKLKDIQGIMTATEVIMENLIKNRKTIIKNSSVVYNRNLNDNIFSKRFLEEW
ncbi:MAG TPA: outer membrane lipoprotein-sorting protein [Desulfarculaceae bacterium]|nr:outer membrane lipoprotein-sorting protein [Desulfarculaceae bacterium]